MSAQFQYLNVGARKALTHSNIFCLTFLSIQINTTEVFLTPVIHNFSHIVHKAHVNMLSVGDVLTSSSSVLDRTKTVFLLYSDMQ